MKEQLKTILCIEEADFRRAGKYGDELMSILREREDWIKDNVLSIKTIMKFTANVPIMAALNIKLMELRRQGIILVNVRLD